MIFLTITTSFTGALIYDRREKRRAQQKWCDLVAHLSKESLPIEQTRRKLTIFLAAPPGDGVRVAREYFQEYVKPVLVAAALDYNVVEGRREGDVRAGLAERIRKHRRKAGEPSTVVEETGIEEVIAEARQRIGVYDEPCPKGDLIIGRHTWKEYIRGLHEGWLGPLDPPAAPAAAEERNEPVETPATETDAAAPTADSPESNTGPEKPQEKPQEKKDDKPSKPTGPTPAYLATAEYPSQSLPPTIPSAFDGSVPIPFPHILGFLNTPIRIYRYLTQRYLADSVGREVAAIVLASATRPYQEGIHTNLTSTDDSSPLTTSNPSPEDPSSTDPLTTQQYEQHTILADEEKEWHKSIYKQRTDSSNPDKHNNNNKEEREWLDDIVLDPRIATRMQRYILSGEEQARAESILSGQEYILGEVRPKHVPFWKRMWIKYGYGEDEEVVKRRSIIGNLDGEDGL